MLRESLTQRESAGAQTLCLRSCHSLWIFDVEHRRFRRLPGAVSADIAGHNSGIFSSAVNMGGQVGAAITASLTPWIAQRFGWNVSFGLAGALAVISALCWLTVHPERPLDA